MDVDDPSDRDIFVPFPEAVVAAVAVVTATDVVDTLLVSVVVVVVVNTAGVF